MEKGNGGEKKAEVEAGNGGERKVEVAGDGGENGKKPAPAACFTKPAAGDDATLLDTTKDYFKQLKVTDADTHWACVKNRVRLAKEYVADKTSSVTNPPFSPRLPLRGDGCASVSSVPCAGC
jgi:hypothetical protein